MRRGEMSKEIMVFDFKDNNVRVIADEQGEPWFVAKDMCGVLGISNHRDALSRLDDGERGSVVVNTPGGPQQTGTVNESGLYSLIMLSRKPGAKAFKRWIAREVLPAILKTRGYTTSMKTRLQQQKARSAMSRSPAGIKRRVSTFIFGETSRSRVSSCAFGRRKRRTTHR
jgi:prophage antirepressor-like protein